MKMKTTKQIAAEITATEADLAQIETEAARLEALSDPDDAQVIQIGRLAHRRRSTVAKLDGLRKDLAVAQEEDAQAEREADLAELRRLDAAIEADTTAFGADLEEIEAQARTRLDAHNTLIRQRNSLYHRIHRQPHGGGTIFSGDVGGGVALAHLGQALAAYRTNAHHRRQDEEYRARCRVENERLAQERRRHEEARRLREHAAHDLARAQMIVETGRVV